MKKIILLAIIAALSLSGEELKVKAKLFNSDQKKGISVFEGDVNINEKTLLNVIQEVHSIE